MILLLAACVLAQPRDLKSEIARIAHTVDGQVGAAAQVLEGGPLISYNGSHHFATQSVYKLPISMAVLSLTEHGKLSLDKPIQVTAADMVPQLHSPLRDSHPNGATVSIRELIRYAIVESDGSASDVLYKLAGGGAAVTGYLRSIGVKDFTAARTEREQMAGEEVQYENWLTPQSAIQLLRMLSLGRCLNSPDRELVLRFMRETNTAPHRLHGLLPGVEIAHKSGTSGMVGGLARATNDIGIIKLPDGRHLLVAVLVRDSRAGEAARDQVIARIAMVAYEWFARLGSQTK